MLSAVSIRPMHAVADTTLAPAAEVAAPTWDRPLPFAVEWALMRGIELPNPFGAGLFIVYMSRDFEVKDVRVTLHGNEPVSVGDVASFDVRNHTALAAIKFDARIPPRFLRRHGLALSLTDEESDGITEQGVYWMNPLFQALQLESVRDNVFKLIEHDWMLITAGPLTHYNTMTANWGGLGNLWNRKVSFCFVRPQRYTYQFMEASLTFSLAFFAERYRPALDLCGSRSGREIDKAAASGLTPIEITPGITSFAEARLVLECKKIYFQDINAAHFVESSIADLYPARDYHRMYIGEILHCWAGGAA